METLEFSDKSIPVETVIMCAMTVLEMYFLIQEVSI